MLIAWKQWASWEVLANWVLALHPQGYKKVRHRSTEVELKAKENNRVGASRKNDPVGIEEANHRLNLVDKRKN